MPVPGQWVLDAEVEKLKGPLSTFAGRDVAGEGGLVSMLRDAMLCEPHLMLAGSEHIYSDDL